MSILEEFCRFLRSDAFIAQKLDNRLDIGRGQQSNKMPYGILSELYTEQLHDLQGETGVSKTDVQLDFWNDGPDGLVLVKQLAIRVRSLLSGFSGTFVTNGLEVQSAIVTRFDPNLGMRPQDGSDNYLRRASVDVDIIHADPLE
jgi:hypothetical protein